MEIVLNTFGAKLRIRNGMFLVILPDLAGLKQHREESIPVHEVKAIVLQKSTSLSTDVVIYALENDIDIIFLNHFGHPVGRLLPSKPSSILTTWQRQLEVSRTAAGLRIARDWILEKMNFQIKFFERLAPYRKGEKLETLRRGQRALKEAFNKLHAFSINPADLKASAEAIRGIEGACQKAYWATLNQLLPAAYQFDGRSRRPGQDLFNAYLNYAYGILYRYIESALFRAGLHPYIGFMHADQYQRPNLVFDFIEPNRVWVDHLVFKIFSAKDALQKQVLELMDGGVWLGKEGTTAIATAFSDRICKKTYPFQDGKNYHLDRIMFLKAQSLGALLRGERGPVFSAN